MAPKQTVDLETAMPESPTRLVEALRIHPNYLSRTSQMPEHCSPWRSGETLLPRLTKDKTPCELLLVLKWKVVHALKGTWVDHSVFINSDRGNDRTEKKFKRSVHFFSNTVIYVKGYNLCTDT